MEAIVSIEIRRSDGHTDTVRRESSVVRDDDQREADMFLGSALSYALDGTCSTPMVVLAEAIQALDERDLAPNMIEQARTLTDAAAAYCKANKDNVASVIGRTPRG